MIKSVLVQTKMVSTHSRPKAAGFKWIKYFFIKNVSTHSRPKAAGEIHRLNVNNHVLFQHTAARRRLVMIESQKIQQEKVSTHSRPKAAGTFRRLKNS